MYELPPEEKTESRSLQDAIVSFGLLLAMAGAFAIDYQTDHKFNNTVDILLAEFGFQFTYWMYAGAR